MIRRRPQSTKPRPEELRLMEAIYEAWTDPGTHPGYHERMKTKVRAFMPILARRLDNLAKVRGEQKEPRR